MRTPAEYATTLRSRAAMAQFIFDNTTQRYYDHTRPFCFNVKLWKLDLSLDNLYNLWTKDTGRVLSKSDLNYFKETLTDKVQEGLYASAVEEARMQYESGTYEVWPDRSLVVDLGFYGRSGGWLAINAVSGFCFTGLHTEGWKRQFLKRHHDDEGIPYDTLRDLYRLVVHLKHDTDNAEKEIEYRAAMQFFSSGLMTKPHSLRMTLESGAKYGGSVRYWTVNEDGDAILEVSPNAAHNYMREGMDITCAIGCPKDKHAHYETEPVRMKRHDGRHRTHC